MSHFYNCKNPSEPQFEAEVGTPAQARKAGEDVYPSVTTVLGIVKDSFLDDVYKPRMLTELARDNPDLPWSDLTEMVYGTRPHPKDGELIPSHEFGTSVHATIERMINHQILGIQKDPGESCWDKWASPFLDWITENNVQAVACEKLVSHGGIKIAGSVDFVGMKDSRIFLADYKCRVNTKGKPKRYQKDCSQLAIEAYMIMQLQRLPYLPKIRSVIVDCDTAEHMHYEWTEKETQWGIRVAKAAANLYWMLRMQPVVKQ